MLQFIGFVFAWQILCIILLRPTTYIDQDEQTEAGRLQLHDLVHKNVNLLLIFPFQTLRSQTGWSVRSGEGWRHVDATERPTDRRFESKSGRIDLHYGEWVRSRHKRFRRWAFRFRLWRPRVSCLTQSCRIATTGTTKTCTTAAGTASASLSCSTTTVDPGNVLSGNLKHVNVNATCDPSDAGFYQRRTDGRTNSDTTTATADTTTATADTTTATAATTTTTATTAIRASPSKSDHADCIRVLGKLYKHKSPQFSFSIQISFFLVFARCVVVIEIAVYT